MLKHKQTPLILALLVSIALNIVLLASGFSNIQGNGETGRYQISCGGAGGDVQPVIKCVIIDTATGKVYEQIVIYGH